jgi:hypothetical protein
MVCGKEMGLASVLVFLDYAVRKLRKSWQVLELTRMPKMRVHANIHVLRQKV